MAVFVYQLIDVKGGKELMGRNLCTVYVAERIWRYSVHTIKMYKKGVGSIK
jgi:hypothetical protein